MALAAGPHGKPQFGAQSFSHWDNNMVYGRHWLQGMESDWPTPLGSWQMFVFSTIQAFDLLTILLD